ncbi:SCP2 sterol-binding domain-containing protein [Oceanospirillum sp.]|uniref:SCP2 sterol-binding domain-containing protein n=1 Tax=Oceanospirillum sp. TaxID=2021254 RepID=UPI003A8CC630
MTFAQPTRILLHGALESAEQLISPLLKRDATARSQLGMMAGKVIRVRCIQPEMAVLIWPSEQGVSFELDNAADAELSGSDLKVDAEVEGRLSDFVRFMLAGDRRETLLFEGALTLRGNTGLVRKLQQVVSTLDLDLASFSEKLIGVVPTAVLSAPFTGFARWCPALSRTAMQDWQEYLQYELALLPAAAELKGYSDGVLNARRSMDRLNARVERLKQQVQALSGDQLKPHLPSESHT